MGLRIYVLLCSIYAVWRGVKAQNLLNNADFEEELGFSNWYCSGGCSIEQNQETFQGDFSAKLGTRSAPWQGVTQKLAVTPGGRYHFVIHIKLVNQDRNKLWDGAQAQVVFKLQDDTSRYARFGVQPQLREEQGWQRIGGDFRVPDSGVDETRVVVQMSDVDAEFLVDSASLTEITVDPDWKNKANQRIDQLRKSNVILKVNLGSSYNPADITIEVNQTRKSFPFGSVVKADRMVDTSAENLKYQKFFYDTFTWGVTGNAMKWKPMEKERFNINFCWSDYAIDKMIEKGIKIRGHNMYWGVEKHVPDWLKLMSGPEVMLEVYRRAMSAGTHYKGRVEHWDLNNEQLHGHFFEQATNNPYFLSKMFSYVKDFDRSAKLFLNDYQIITKSDFTYAMLKSAYDLQAQGTPADGIGLQSHFSAYPDIHRIIKRLDVLSEVNTPLWVTELDVSLEDGSRKAQAYEDLLTLFYSRPEIEGIMLWGFWDQAHWRPEAALLEGDDLEPNEAGLKFLHLMNDRWMTSLSLETDTQVNRYEFRGFHGDYDVTIRAGNDVIKRQSFVVSENNVANVEISV